MPATWERDSVILLPQYPRRRKQDLLLGRKILYQECKRCFTRPWRLPAKFPFKYVKGNVGAHASPINKGQQREDERDFRESY